MKKKYICFLFLVISSVALSAEWYVDPYGSADPNGSAANPLFTIQDALNEAATGDSIILKPGVYTGAGNYNLNPGGKILTIQSTDPTDPDMITQTIIDPNYLGRAFLFQTDEDPNFILSGFTIRNTWLDISSDPPHGSAIHCSGASPTIRSCVFHNCNANAGWGGAFYGEFCHSRLEHCLFFDNYARYGGALAINLGSQIILDHCTIVGNQAFFYGGGIICDFYSTGIITNSILYFNRLSETGNTGQQASVRSSVLNVSFSDLSNLSKDLQVDNKSVLISNEGMIHIDPNFVSYNPSVQPTPSDFHLRSIYGRWDSCSSTWVQDTVTSPCIDTGDPNLSWTEEPWPNGKHINMGYFGGTKQASMNGRPADFNLSGTVDLEDLSEFIDLWLNNTFSDIHDLNQNGKIDYMDFEKISRDWGWEE